MAFRLDVLRYVGDLVPMPDMKDRGLLNMILDDNFWAMEPVSGASLFERGDDDDNTLLLNSSIKQCFRIIVKEKRLQSILVLS